MGQFPTEMLPVVLCSNCTRSMTACLQPTVQATVKQKCVATGSVTFYSGLCNILHLNGMVCTEQFNEITHMHKQSVAGRASLCQASMARYALVCV